MRRTFSTKIDDHILRLLDHFCEQYHLKKTRVLEEIIAEGIQKRAQLLELAASIQRGLQDEASGDLYRADEVEESVFGRKKES